MIYFFLCLKCLTWRPHENEKLAARKIMQYKYRKSFEKTTTKNSCSVAFKQAVCGKEGKERQPKAEAKAEIKSEEGTEVMIDFEKASVKKKKDLKLILKKCESFMAQVTKNRSGLEKQVKDQLGEAMNHFTQVIDKTQICLDNVEKKDKVTEEDYETIVTALKDIEKAKTLFEEMVSTLIGDITSKGKRGKAEAVSDK